MNKTFKVVKVDPGYCDFLRKYDCKVAYNKGKKELRPFIGILFKIDTYEYFAPLSSPKPKHKKMKNSLDFIKIKNGELGVINFNNMIPITKYNYTLINLNKENLTEAELKYHSLLQEQLWWLNEHYNQIIKKSYNLYILYKSDKLVNNIKNRCCNFKLLEDKCLEYNS